MEPSSGLDTSKISEPVTTGELNSWRRGFTPQAEIWNGRMAMIGLAVGLSIILLARLSIN